MLAGLHLLWLASLAAAAVNDIPILGLVIVALLITGLAGVYGNTLYFRAFRRAVDHVTKTGKGSYEELRGQLAQAGGTSIAALGVMATLSLIGVAGAIAVTYYLRGGFLFNPLAILAGCPQHWAPAALAKLEGYAPRFDEDLPSAPSSKKHLGSAYNRPLAAAFLD